MSEFLRDMMYSNIDPTNKLLQHDQDINDVKMDLAENAKKGGNIKTITQSPYNAKLDGVTDDSTAIVNALNDVKALGGGVVYIPYTQQGIRITRPFTIPKGVLLLGEGTPSAGYLSGGTKGTGLFQKSYFIMDEVVGSSQYTTGSITTGQNTLTVASVIDFAVGQYISVINAGLSGVYRLDSKITAINGTTITLQDNAITTATNTKVIHTPAFNLSDNSGMERFGFYYKTVDTNITTGDVPTFPFTIHASGYGLHLKDLTSMGASHFISIGAFERGFVEGINGLVTKMGFRIRRSRDISRISKVHFNPNIVYSTKDGVATENFSTYFTDLMKSNFIGFRFGSADIFQMTDILSIFTNKAIEVVPINYSDGLGEDFDNYAFCLTGKDLAFDNTKYGLYIQRDLSFTAKITNLDIIPISTDGQAVGITMTGGASGFLSISNFGSKGTTGQTAKHLVLDSTGVSMVDIAGARFIGVGTPTVRNDYTDMFTVTGNNRLNAEILFSKTNSGGVYRAIQYSSDAKQFPSGLQVNNFSLEESATGIEFQVIRRDGGDNKTVVFGVDNVGGISGGFSQSITAGATATYDLRGSNNSNGRGKFIVMADFSGYAVVEGYSNGGAIVASYTGANASTTQNNASTLNVFMASSGILSIQNNLGSNRNVSVVFFPASR